MTRKALVGPRIRRLRKRHGFSQAELAGRLEISPSYLNLIEHNQRSLTVPVLLKLGQLFGDEVATLGTDDQRLTNELVEVFGDMLFDGDGVTRDEVDDAVQTSPVFARAVLKLYRAFRDQRERTRELAERIDGDVDLASSSSRGPAEEVSDFIQAADNHFLPIEEAAERLIAAEGIDVTHIGQQLREVLEARFGVVTEVLADDRALAPMRRYDARAKRLILSESLAPRSRHFQLAHQVGLLAHGELFDDLVSELSEPARALGRVALANFFAGAVLMPYEPFLEAAKAMRYDVERLGHRFRTSFEQVCHRLTTLRHPEAKGVPFHMIRVDIAGNISKRFSASGIEFARFGGACPRWNVFRSFLQPGFIQTQLSQMPDGQRFFCIARTVRREAGGYGRAQTRFALGLGCPVSHARELVYADGVDLGERAPAEPIGTTCRLCERTDCTQRAFPPMQQAFVVDENVRHASFYVSGEPRRGSSRG